MNLGLGLRGPPGFYRAVLASNGDDARGAALVILGVLLVTAGATATLAPFLVHGLVALAGGAAIVLTGSVIVMKALEPAGARS